MYKNGIYINYHDDVVKIAVLFIVFDNKLILYLNLFYNNLLFIEKDEIILFRSS